MRRAALVLALLAAAPLLAQEPPANGEVGWHVVQPGESLESITQKYLGSTRAWRENWRLNPDLSDPNALRPGQRIRVFTSLAERTAAIKAVSRRVDQKIASEDWSNAQLGQTLRERDGLRTGARSSAALGMDDGTDLVLGETSIVFLREMSGKLEGVTRQSLEVVEGQADVGRAKRPTGAPASASADIEVILGGTRVRNQATADGGAQLRNRRAKDGSAQVMSYGGASELEAPGGRVTLPEGTGSTVKRNGSPSAPERLLPAPAAVEPKADAELDHSNPTFRWQRVAGAAAYLVEVCRDALCGSVVERSGRVADIRWTVLRLPLGKYFWRVTATAESGLDGYPTTAFPFEVKALWRRPPTPVKGATSPPRR